MSQNSLTAVLHAAVKSAPSGVDARTTAELINKAYSTLMAELGQQEGHKLGADLVIPLIKITGSDAPMNFLARECGGVFIPLQNILQNKESELAISMLSSVKEFGEFAAELANNIADGIINQGEYNRIMKEGHEAATAIMAVLEHVRKTHEAQYGHLYKKSN